MTSSSIQEILEQRGKTHGDFTDHAQYCQEIKGLLHAKGQHLNDIQMESLEMIAHKIARILAGNPNVRDHWDDIAGYAKLVSDRITEADPAPRYVKGE